MRVLPGRRRPLPRCYRCAVTEISEVQRELWAEVCPCYRVTLRGYIHARENDFGSWQSVLSIPCKNCGNAVTELRKYHLILFKAGEFPLPLLLPQRKQRKHDDTIGQIAGQEGSHV